MLQGTHFPIAILAGIGLAALLSRLKPGAARNVRVITAALLFVLGLTNLRFVVRDLENYRANSAQTRQQRPYLQSGEMDAIQWVTSNIPPDAAVQPLPWIARASDDPNRHVYAAIDSSIACFLPGLTGRKVYCGHWGETPSFQDKLGELRRFEIGRMDADQQRAFLRKMNVRYLIFSQKAAADQLLGQKGEDIVPLFRGMALLPPYLRLAYSNEDADIYQIDASVFAAP